MEIGDIINRIELGEDSTTQFKENITSNASLSEEMVALSNALGGIIIVGVKDTGEISGLSSSDIRKLNNMISNVASEHVKPPVSPITQTVKIENKIVMIIDIKQGANKPYSTNNGTYLTKSGADKRRISQEELQRLFQDSNRLHADEMLVTNSKIEDIDFFINPSFLIKAVSFVGNELSGSEYRDSEDIKGNIPKLYKESMSFLTRNLHKRQKEQGFNSEGELEIPKIVLEEILVNAIIHRDYFIEAPINLFIFDNRIEIISPGKLPNSITVENIKHGISVIRNPIITSFATKILPYRGIGSGIIRAIKNYEKIGFVNNLETERFKVIILR